MKLFHQAIEAHKNQQWNTAEKLYLELIYRFKDPKAMSYLGSLYSHLQHYEHAEYYFKSSLTINPNQLDTRYNLGICLKKQDKLTEAINHLSSIVKTHRTNEMYFYSLIDACILNDELTSAKNYLDTALKAFPKSYKLIHLSAIIEEVQGNIDRAEFFLKKALSINNKYLPSLNKLGMLQKRNNNIKASIETLSAAIKTDNQNFQLHHNIANSYSDSFQYLRAVEHYEKALTLNSLYRDTHLNLNHIYWKLGKKDQFLDSYKPVNFKDKNNCQLFFDYCNFLLLSAPENCEKELERYESYHYSSYQILEIKAKIYALKKDYLTTEKLLLEATVVSQDIDLQYQLLENQFILEKYESVNDIATNILKEFPSDIHALAYKNLISKTNDIGSLIHIKDDVLSDKQTGLRNTLIKSLNSLHSDNTEPIDQTLHKGTQTPGNLFEYQDHHIQTFFELVKLTIEQYIYRNKNIHPILRTFKNPEFKITSAWSVKLRSEGFHNNHIHPMGVLSCVYYVELPKEMDTDQGKAGWLKFGEHNIRPGNINDLTFIEPKQDRLVIFPSYFWHGTVPFKSNNSRLTIAFDISVNEKLDI